MPPVRVRSRPRRRPSVVPLLAIGVAVAAAVPLGFVVRDVATSGWAQVGELVFRPRTGELLWNTIRIVVATVVLTAIIGTASAWLVVRTAVPLRRTLTALAIAPLAVPAYVTAYAWSSLLPAADGFWGALIVVTLSYTPFVFLPVAASLRALDPALEESAASLGISQRAVFVRVVLPQLRPALLGGGLLVALHLVAEFGAFQLVQFPTLSTGVYDQYQSSFAGPAATTMAGVLLLLALVLLLGELRLRGRESYARAGSGSSRRQRLRPLGAWRFPALGTFAVLVVAGVGVPMFAIVRWMIEGTSTSFDVADLVRTTMTTVGYAAVAAAVTTIAATPVVWAAVRRPGWLTTVAERITFFATGLPGIVIALALVTIALRVVPDLYQTASMLLVAYAILFLPRAIVAARAGMLQTSPSLDDAAASLGHGPLATLRRVTGPLLLPHLLAGAALVFIGVSTELTATLLLSPIGTDTLATRFWSHSTAIEYGAAAPYAALMVLVSAPAAYLLSRSER